MGYSGKGDFYSNTSPNFFTICLHKTHFFNYMLQHSCPSPASWVPDTEPGAMRVSQHRRTSLAQQPAHQAAAKTHCLVLQRRHRGPSLACPALPRRSTPRPMLRVLLHSLHATQGPRGVARPEPSSSTPGTNRLGQHGASL